MRILHVVAGLPTAGGGLAEFVPRLALETAGVGHDVTIATVARLDEQLSHAVARASAGGVRIVKFALAFPRQAFFSWELVRGLPTLVAWADIVHVHSNWTFPVWWACRCALSARKPLVMSPHGCLDPVRLAHSRWKKRLVGPIDTACLRHANVIHATSEAERTWIEGFVGGHPRIKVIHNAVDLLPFPTAPKPADRVRQVLSLGRLHPLKGLDTLIDAWHLATKDLRAGHDWRLVIAGPDEQGMRAILERKAGRLGLENIRFPGPLYGDAKAQAFSDADLFILPSRSENFGLVVAEALSAGIPVITTTATPWAEIDRISGWWVDGAAEPLGTALRDAMHRSDGERTAMGAHGRALVEAKFRWPHVAHGIVDLYADLAGLTALRQIGAQYHEGQRP